ncbi:6-phospho-3-hexuloisomerase [Xylocopilactobacillus apis]|nr:6-phospho-3-hexuloisomerase [Xylocopilactobacillus apis]
MTNEYIQICTELSGVSSNLTDEKANEVLKLIFNSNKIFLSGEGRSGLMVKAFANRLTQMGLNVHVVTEITAPAIGSEDLLIFNTASGKSEFLISQAKSAIKVGAKLVTFTANKDSVLSQKSDAVIVIDAQTKDEEQGSLQPMGSLYEQTSLLVFDSLMLRALNMGLVTNTKLRSTHSNLE